MTAGTPRALPPLVQLWRGRILADVENLCDVTAAAAAERPDGTAWQRMTEEHAAAMARVAELADYQDALMADRIPFAEAYAVAARAEEREACARICDGLITGHTSAAAIRARGSQPEAGPTPTEDEARVDALMAKARPVPQPSKKVRP